MDLKLKCKRAIGAAMAHLEAAAAQGGDAAIVIIGAVWAVEAATAHGAITSRVNC